MAAVHIVQVFEGKRASTATPRLRRGSRRFYFRAIARNGEIVSASESYTRRYDAMRAARRLFPREGIVHID
jgi:hypothetical protein